MGLKPCPFCGAEADIHVVDVTRSQDLRFKYEYQPGCETDKCPGEWGGSSYCSADEAYEKWNTRATEPLLHEMADALLIAKDIINRYANNNKKIAGYSNIEDVLQKYHERESTKC